MPGLPRVGFVKLLAGALFGGALLLGPLSPPASASGPTTHCQLTAQNSPTTLGQQANFRFFAAARAPEDLPPSPSGVVSFFEGATFLGAEFLAPDLTSDNNAVVFSTSSLSLGDHTIFAVLVGPSGPCPGIPPSASHHVNPPPAQPSDTGVASSANPSRSGQDVTFTATITRQGGGAVAGTVQFQADGSDLGGPQAVDASGHASVSTSTLAVGNHAITAAFTSSNPNTLNSSGGLAGGQTVQAADTQTTVTSSGNPSELGQAVTFTAQVSTVAPGAGTPGGTVQFSDNGTSFGSPQGLDGSGRASITTSGLAVGTHTIGATYTPSGGSFNGSSGSVSQTVERARTSLSYDGATSGDFHDPAVLAATLTRTYDASPIAGKSVHFTMASQSCDGITDAAGRASCTITPQEPAGGYTVTASFAGDAGSQPSSDSDPFTVTREQTSLDYTGGTAILNGGTLHASALLKEDDGAPAISGRSVTFTLGSGATAQSCTGLTDSAGRAACDIAGVSQPLGPGTVQSVFAQDAYYLTSSDSDATIVYAFPSRGAFAVGDRSSAMGASVTFFGAQWDSANSLSGGAAPNAFKGFATSPGSPPSCGGTFVADPGNSGSPPATVPSYMGTLVTSKVTKSGSNITGTVTHLVVVKTSSYGPSPGAGGKGTVVAVIC